MRISIHTPNLNKCGGRAGGQAACLLCGECNCIHSPLENWMIGKSRQDQFCKSIDVKGFEHLRLMDQQLADKHWHACFHWLRRGALISGEKAPKSIRTAYLPTSSHFSVATRNVRVAYFLLRKEHRFILTLFWWYVLFHLHTTQLYRVN